MYSNSITFNDFVEEQSLAYLKSWLLDGFEESNFRPFYLSFEPSAAVQLKYAFAELTDQSQRDFKEAIIKATSEWRLATNHKPETLDQLVCLAAYIRADEIIDVLRVLIKSDRLTGLKTETMYNPPINAYEEVVECIVAVLQGFAAPPSAAKTVLEELFYDDSFDSRFAAQLFLGLCKCTREKYTDYVPRFLNFQKSHPDYYSMPHIMHGLVAIVSLETIGKNISNLHPQWVRERFLDFLVGESWSPACGPWYDRDLGTTKIIEKKVIMKSLLRDPSEPIQGVPLSLDSGQRGQEREPVSSDQDDQEIEKIEEDYDGSAVDYGKQTQRW